MRFRFGALACSCSIFMVLFASTESSEAQQPIPTDARAYTYRKWAADMMKFRERDIALYRKHTKDPREVRENAIALLHAAAEKRLPDRLGPSGKDLLELSRITFQNGKGSQDPLVRTWWAIALCKTAAEFRSDQRLGIATDIIDTCMSCEESYKQSPYSNSARFLAAAHMAAVAIEINDRRAGTAINRAMEAGATLIADKKIDASQQRLVYYDLQALLLKLSTKQWAAFLELCRKQPDANPWTLDLLIGEYHVNRAWEERGSGWADSLTPEKAQGFSENLKLAAEHLSRAWKLQPQFPEAPQLMIKVAMAGACAETPREWFDRAVAGQMDYTHAYRSLLWALRPRWGGSHSAMYQFGKECADTERFDTGVPLELVQALSEIDDDMGNNGEAWRRPGVYARVKQCLEGMARSPVWADEKRAIDSHTRILSRYAVVSLLAREYQDCRAVLDKTGDRLDFGVFDSFGLTPRYDIARVYALTGKARKEVEQVEELLGRDDKDDPEVLARARALWEKARKQDAAPRAECYFKNRAALFQEIEDYHTGRWVDLSFDDGLGGWRRAQGNWQSSEDGKIVGGSSPKKRGFVLVRERGFPPPFEIELEYADVTSVHFSVGVGISLGDTDERGDGRAFWCCPDQRTVGASCWGEPQQGKRIPSLPERGRMRVKAWNGRFAMYLDDELVLQADDVVFDAAGRIGIGTQPWMQVTGKAMFAKLRIRKLDEKEPAHPKSPARVGDNIESRKSSGGG